MRGMSSSLSSAVRKVLTNVLGLLRSAVFRGWPRRSRRLFATLAAIITVMGAGLSEATPATADTSSGPFNVSASGPPGLLNLSALELPAVAFPVGCGAACQAVYYPAGVYSATSAQIASLEDLENQAITNTITDHSLSPTDSNEVLSWGRSDADVELWALLVQAIGAVKAGTASTDQTNAVAWLQAVVVREGVLAAQDAGLEYTKWAGLGIAAYEQLLTTDPSESALENFLGGVPQAFDFNDTEGYCVYQSPSPYQSDYTANVQTPMKDNTAPQQCFSASTDTVITNPPTVPGEDQFTKWGEADADNNLFDNSSYAGASQSIAIGASLAAVAIGGSVATGVGVSFGLAGALAGPIAKAAVQAVLPYALRAFAQTTQLGVTAGTTSAEAGGSGAAAAAEAGVDAAETAAGAIAATGVGVIVAAVIAAVVTAVQEGLILFTPNGVPGELAQNIVNAPSAIPDLGSMLSDSSEMQGLYGLFVGATLPAPTFTGCTNNALVVTSSAGLPVPNTPCLNATPIPVWSSSDPQWVVTPKGGTTSTTQPTISWQDASTGLDATGYLDGNWFIDNATVGGTTASVQSLRMQYTDWNGNEQTAWLFANDSPPEFLTVSDAAMGANFDPSTCLTAGTCSFAQSIDFVGADGHDYSASVTGGAEAPPVPETTCPAQQVTGVLCVPSSATTTTVAGPTAVLVGQPATFTATVGALGLEGTVDFSGNFTDLCPGTGLKQVTLPSTSTNDGGIQIITVGATVDQASCTTTFTKPGTEYLFATFSGDAAGDEPSQGELTVNVLSNPVDTTASLAASTTTPAVGQPVTYTATFSDTAGVTPTGSVTFTNGNTTLCSAVSLSTSAPFTATCSATYQAPFSAQTVTAKYSGDTTTVSSKAQVTVNVKDGTTTSLSSSPGAPASGQPLSLTVGQSLSLTAQVDGTTSLIDAPVPTGTLTFSVDGQQVGDPVAVTRPSLTGTPGVTGAPLTEALATSAPITNLAPGVHQVVATYQGDSNYAGSVSSTLTVNVVIAVPNPTFTLVSPPDAPTGLSSTPGNSQVVLNWTSPANNGGDPVTGYNIYQGTSSGAETILTSTSTTATMFTSTGLTNGTTYYFKITAVSPAGEGPFSNEVFGHAGYRCRRPHYARGDGQ